MMCARSPLQYLDHVKVILMRENSIHFTVQLLKSVLNGVNLQCVIALIFTDKMVACKTMESLKAAAYSNTVRLEN